MNMKAPKPDKTPANKIDLTKVVKGKVDAPLRVLLYGIEGIGKSSWAMKAPGAVFLCAESGTDDLDVQRLPLPEKLMWQDIKEAVRALAEDSHDFKTLVVDTLDAVEPLLWDYICERDGKESIEDYGYGKGYVAALNEWRSFLAALESMRRNRKMNVILIAHSYIKPFKNPEGDDYDRYELKLNIKAGGLLKEWVDDVLFAHYETFAVKSDDSKVAKAKGVSTGARIVETNRTAAWDAKNRHSLPSNLPLDFDEFVKAVKAHRPIDPGILKASITDKLAKIADEKLTARVTTDLEKAGDDAVELAKIENKLTVTLNRKAA